MRPPRQGDQEEASIPAPIEEHQQTRGTLLRTLEAIGENSMSSDDLLKRILTQWPNLDVLSFVEKEWLLEAHGRLTVAGAKELAQTVSGDGDQKPSLDSIQNRAQLLDLLAEVRTGMSLVEYGFRLEYETPGRDGKSVDFLATRDDVRVWIEVKRPNLDQRVQEFMEKKDRSKPVSTIVYRSKDDVRIGRLTRDAADKMPDSSDPKIALIFVENMDEYELDARNYLFTKTIPILDRDQTGQWVKIGQTTKDTGRWSTGNDCPLAAVIIAAPTPEWPYCGPMLKHMFVNPEHSAEARLLENLWPMERISHDERSV